MESREKVKQGVRGEEEYGREREASTTLERWE